MLSEMLFPFEPAGFVTEWARVSSALGSIARDMTGESIESAEPGATEASKRLVPALIESGVLIKAATGRELSLAGGALVCAGVKVAVSNCVMDSIALASSQGRR